MKIPRWLLISCLLTLISWPARPAQALEAPTEIIIADPTTTEQLFPWGQGRAAVYEEFFALPYRTASGVDSLYLYDRAGHASYIQLPDTFHSNERANAEYVLSSPTDFWIWSGVLGRSALRHYRLSGGGVLPTQAALVSKLPLGDYDTRPGGLIRLASGALVGAWYQHVFYADRHIDIGFLYVTPQGVVSTIYPVRGAGNYGGLIASAWTLVQHPGDGAIWAFYKRDSYHEISAVHLAETPAGLQVDWVQTDFIGPAAGSNAPEYEYPYLASAADPATGAIRLAYQNRQYNLFYVADEAGNYLSGSCGDPGPGVLDPNLFVKGAPISIAEIAADGSKSFVLFPQYVERAWYFGFSVAEGLWLAYQPIGCQNTTYYSMYRAGNVLAATYDGAWHEAAPLGQLDDSKDYYAATILYDIQRPGFVLRLNDDQAHAFSFATLPAAPPTPTETPAALPTPTETPAALPTPTETPIPLPTPTETPAAPPTPTETPAAPPAPTETPAAPPTPTETPIPLPTLPAMPTNAMSVTDLDGIVLQKGRNWMAQIKILLLDAQGRPVSSAQVTGDWSGGYFGSDSCTTNRTGWCTMKSPSLQKEDSVTFTVTAAYAAAYTYAPEQNSDPDGDSDGTSITISFNRLNNGLPAPTPIPAEGGASVSGHVWLDRNGDGQLTEGQGDTALPGVTLALSQAGEDVAIVETDSEGAYQFAGLLPGDYAVRVTDSKGVLNRYRVTRPGPNPRQPHNSQAQPYWVALDEGTHDAAADFGYTQVVALRGRAWQDWNANGLADESPLQGLGGVTIVVAEPDGAAVAQATTAADGRFEVEGLLPGSYRVAASLPGYFPTTEEQQLVGLISGQVVDSLGFGYIMPTGVAVQGLSASAEPGQVTLTWSAIGAAAGFHVWRADNVKGYGAQRLTATPVTGDAQGGHRFTDRAAVVGLPYFYWVEDLSSSERIGPVTAAAGRPVGRIFLPLIVR